MEVEHYIKFRLIFVFKWLIRENGFNSNYGVLIKYVFWVVKQFIFINIKRK